ncbi:MAG: hypothetical protein ACXAE3_09865 [Candidatus Kariarchaeaceae archaeon]
MKRTLIVCRVCKFRPSSLMKHRLMPEDAYDIKYSDPCGLRCLLISFRLLFLIIAIIAAIRATYAVMATSALANSVFVTGIFLFFYLQFDERMRELNLLTAEEQHARLTGYLPSTATPAESVS